MESWSYISRRAFGRTFDVWFYFEPAIMCCLIPVIYLTLIYATMEGQGIICSIISGATSNMAGRPRDPPSFFPRITIPAFKRAFRLQTFFCFAFNPNRNVDPPCPSLPRRMVTPLCCISKLQLIDSAIAGHARRNVASVTVSARLAGSAQTMEYRAKAMKCVCVGDPALPREVTLPAPRHH